MSEELVMTAFGKNPFMYAVYECGMEYISD